MRFALDDSDRSPKQHGRYLGLWDAPWYRDWLVWFGGGWTLLMFFSIAFPADPDASTSTWPRWLDTSVATMLAAGLFGWLPAYLRGVIRRSRRRRRSVAAPAKPAVPLRSGSPGQPEAPSVPSTIVRASADEGRSSQPTLPPQWQRTPPPSAGSHTSEDPSTRHGPDVPPAPSSSDADADVFTRARQSLPYPVARSVRALQLATEPLERYRAALRCSEAVTVVVGILSTAWARDHQVVTSQTAELQEAYQRGIAQGHWEAVASSIPRVARDHPQALPGMFQAWKSKKGVSGFSNDLKALIQERNTAAHGGEPQNRLEAADRLTTLVPTLQRILVHASFLGDSEWVVVRSARYRRRERDFEITALRVMGDHPDFEVTTFTAQRPLANDVMYVLTEHGPLDLTPLIVLRDCPTCRQPEVAYADRIDGRRGVSLKTFDRGHVLYDASLVEEVQQLFRPVDSGGLAT